MSVWLALAADGTYAALPGQQGVIFLDGDAVELLEVPFPAALVRAFSIVREPLHGACRAARFAVAAEYGLLRCGGPAGQAELRPRLDLSAPSASLFIRGHEDSLATCLATSITGLSPSRSCLRCAAGARRSPRPSPGRWRAGAGIRSGCRASRRHAPRTAAHAPAVAGAWWP